MDFAWRGLVFGQPCTGNVDIFQKMFPSNNLIELWQRAAKQCLSSPNVFLCLRS